MQDVIIIILIDKTKVRLTSKVKTIRTIITLVLVQIVVKIIILHQNADMATESSVIDVMNMDIRLNYVLIMHSN